MDSVNCTGQLLLSHERVDEALAELRKGAEPAPDDASTHIALAKALTAKGMPGEAQEEMRKAQRVQPQ
jgi:Flp pilus assembly protein TadD